MPSRTACPIRLLFLKLLVYAAVPVGGMPQSQVPDTFELILPGGLLSLPCSRLLASIPQLPGRDASFASEAGHAEPGVVPAHFLEQREKLVQAQRPRAFFAM